MSVFVVLGLIISVLHQVIGSEHCLWDYLFLYQVECRTLTW